MSRSWFETKDLWWMRAWERFIYFGLRSFEFLTRPIPLWQVTEFLARIGGWLLPRLPGPRQRLVENFARVYPEMTRDAR
ncbi:MAG: hypothetical protein AAGE90_15045, partial [Pseudomonadota bacterium]